MPASIGADLTPTQRDALLIIRATIRQRGYPPTVSELARARGTYYSAAVELLAALERKRYLRVIPYPAKTLIILEDPCPTGSS